MTEAASLRQSLARWWVVGGVFLLAFITIIDRVSISAAKQSMARELHISDQRFGWIFGAFALGYAAFMLPAGHLVDRYGPRRFLIAIVTVWSLLTIGTGFTAGGFLLVALRFAFGMAEAGAYPAASCAISNWMPQRERGLALGLMNTGTRIGAAGGLWIASWIIARRGWRASFFLLGSAGFAWVLGWYALYRDRFAHCLPTPHSSVERGLIWRRLIRMPAVWLILVQYFSDNFTLFLCYSWLQPYLQDHFHLPVLQAGLYAGIPLYCGAMATWTSGFTVDWLYSRGYGAGSRAYPAMCGFALGAIGVAAAAYMQSPHTFIACLGLATFGVDLTASPSWVVCSDLGGELTGTMSGAMNMAGSLGSFASSSCFPLMLRLSGSAVAYFIVAACLNLLAVACWPAIMRAAQGAGAKGHV